MLSPIIRYDLRLSLRVLMFCLALWLPCMALNSYLVPHVRFILILGSVLAALMPAMIFSREDKFRAAVTLCSLPVTRRQCVRARYLLSWLLMLSFQMLMSGCLVLIPGNNIRAEDLASLPNLLLMLTVTAVTLPVLLPFLLRYGMKGIMILLMAGQGLGVLLVLGALVFRGVAGSTGDPLRLAVGGLRAGIHLFDAIAAAPGWIFILVLILGLIQRGSFLITRNLFEKKEL